MRIVVTHPSRLTDALTQRFGKISPQTCEIILIKSDASDTMPALKSGDGLLILQPADIDTSIQAGHTAAAAGIHYGEAALMESPLAAQQGFMVGAGGTANDLHALAPVLNALAPCTYGWWHIGSHGSAAFVLALLGQLGGAVNSPIDLSNPLPQLAKLAALQQKSGEFAAAYLAKTQGERFVAAMPDRQRPLAAFMDGAESPARQIAHLIQLFSPKTTPQ